MAGSLEMRYLAQTYNDLYESSRKEQETLSYEASHDALTGLGNRAMFERVRNDCDPATTAMILIDIDYFKEVNDTYGHEAGDQLLKRAAKVFRAGFRSEDCVCRIGGDEFAVLMMHSGTHLRALVQRKIELLAVTYLGLSAEDAGRLRTMTQGSRAKLVEEGVHHALEQRSQ